MSKRPILTAMLLATMAASAASAQLLGGGLGLPGPVGGVVGQVGNTIDRTVGNVTGQPGNPASFVNQSNPVSLDSVSRPVAQIAASAPLLSDIRKARLAALIRANRDTLDRDGEGQPVRKGELVVTDPDGASLALAQRAGFRVIRDEQAGDLGIRMVTLSLPRKMDVREGLKALRRAAPALQADYNHIYEPAGGALLPAAAAALAAAPARAGTRIAMIDGGVASHPSLARAGIEQRGFNGPAQPTGHGTAVGSLLVGEQGPFRGAARGAQLFVGDVYGGNPAAGSATAIVRALAWAASKRPSVINVSLVSRSDRRDRGRCRQSRPSRGWAIESSRFRRSGSRPRGCPARQGLHRGQGHQLCRPLRRRAPCRDRLFRAIGRRGSARQGQGRPGHCLRLL